MKRLLSILMVLILFLNITAFVQATEPEDDEEDTSDTTETTAIQTTEYPDEPERAPDLASEAAIVLDAKTGTVLFDKNAYIPEYPASITKIMTCLLALENTSMGDTVTFSENAVYSIDRDSSNVGLNEGEIITVEECLKALMIESANEAAIALAEKISGSVEAFAALMNEKATALGCRNTHFSNPHGLQDANHYTCAYDMALILKAAMDYPAFRSLSAMISGEISPTNLTEEVRPLWNALKMIRPTSKYYYEYIEGGKTGYTTDANCTLATFAKKGEMELICIVLNCGSRKNTYSDTRAGFEYCFRNYSYVYPLEDFSFSSGRTDDNIVLSNFYKSVSRDLLNLSVDRNFCLVLNNSIDKSALTTNISYTQGINTGTLGQLEFSYNGQLLGSTPIVYKSYGIPSTEAAVPAAATAVSDNTMAASENTVTEATTPPVSTEAEAQKNAVENSPVPNTEEGRPAEEKKSRGPANKIIRFLLIIVVLFLLYMVYINIVRYMNRLHRRRRRYRRRRSSSRPVHRY